MDNFRQRVQSATMRSISFAVFVLHLIACSVIADDLSSLSKASRPQIVAAAQAYYDARKKAGKRVDLSDASSYAEGRAIMRDLTDSLKAAIYENAFRAVVKFLVQENGEE
jgi:hypothetical protein